MSGFWQPLPSSILSEFCHTLKVFDASITNVGDCQHFLMLIQLMHTMSHAFEWTAHVTCLQRILSLIGIPLAHPFAILRQ